MPCDYPAWHAAVLDAKACGHLDDWHQVVPPLSSFGPGRFVVDDPHRICSEAIGRHINSGVWSLWEFDSPISRPSEGALVVVD